MRKRVRNIAAFLKKNLHYLFDLVGGILFAAVVYGVVVHNLKIDGITPVLTLGFAAAFVLLQRLIDKLPSKGLAYWGIVAGVFLAMAVLHGIMAYWLAVNLNGGDANVVLTNAINIATGKLPTAYSGEYFARCQNQFGYFFLMLGVAKLGVLLTGNAGFAQFAAFNLFMIEISVLMAVLCAEYIGRKVRVSSCGLRVMTVLAPAPFLWMMVPYAYTDSLCLPFLLGDTLMAMYAMDHIQDDRGILLLPQKGAKDFICFFAMGLLISFGYQIKGNLIILLIAIIMILFVRVSLRKWCELCAALLTGFIVFYMAFSFVTHHSGLLTKEAEARYKLPLTFWVMMAMNNFGSDGEDLSVISSYETYEERQEAVTRRMKEKYEKMGLDGLLTHYYRKATRDGWDSGMFSMDSMLGTTSGSITPVRPNGLHDYVLRTGAHHDRFRPWAHAYWNALEVLALFGFFSLGKRKGMDLVLIRLFITGTVLFFMIWEANWRYIFSSTLFISILAAFEMEALSHMGSLRREKQRLASIKERAFRNVTQDVNEIVGEQMTKKHYAQAEKLVSLYGRLGEAITYGSRQQQSVSEKASAMRRTLSEAKAQQRIVDNVRFYLDLWKNPDDIAQSQLANVIESGMMLRGRLTALDGAQTDESVAGLIRELDMRIQYMKSRLPEDGPDNMAK